MVFALGFAAIGSMAFAAELARANVVLSIILSLVTGVGVILVVWAWRAVPTWRWIVFGVCAGIPLGWLGALSGIS